MEEALKQEAAALGVAEKIVFHGFLKPQEVRSLMKRCQLTAVEDKAIADQELAAAADDNAKAAAQSAVDEAQHRIDSLNAQINQLNAAQTSVQTQSAAAAPSSDGSAADNVPVDDGNAN